MSTDEYSESEHPFDRYLRVKKHPLTAHLQCGVEVWVMRGYIGIEERGHKTYIPRNDLVKLLKWLIPLVRQMDDSVNPRDLVAEYLDHEEQHLRAMRRQKKSRRASGRLRWD